MGLTTDRKGKQMNRSIRISVIFHLLLMLSFVALTRVKSQASVSKPAHMQLTYLARSTQAPAIRLVRRNKPAKAVPSSWCFKGCHGAPPTHRELFKFAGLDRYFVAILPNGVRLSSEYQDPMHVYLIADSTIAPGAYKVTITTTDDIAPTNWGINADPVSHFTYIVVDGPGTYSLQQK
jgi:hypothetical protein